jgi:hypothetical protein
MGCENFANKKIDLGNILDFSDLSLENIKEKVAICVKSKYLYSNYVELFHFCSLLHNYFTQKFCFVLM